jgi:hypothetical protein
MDTRTKAAVALGAVIGAGAVIALSVDDADGKVKNKSIVLKGETATISGETCFFEVTKADGSKAVAAKATGLVLTDKGQVGLQESIEVELPEANAKEVKEAVGVVLKTWRKESGLEE